MSHFSYNSTKEQEKFVDNEVRRIVDEIIKPGMTDFQKVKAINDCVVNNTKHSRVANTSPHAAYTLFNEGKGVCQAYSLVIYRLLEEVEIFILKIVKAKSLTQAYILLIIKFH